jgi:hypothetical protein
MDAFEAGMKKAGARRAKKKPTVPKVSKATEKKTQ